MKKIYLKYKMKYLELRKELINQGIEPDNLMTGGGLFGPWPCINSRYRI